MYDVRAIANWFLERAEKDEKHLTAMKLQKLVYVAHGWYLGLADEPLVHDAVEAWKWGPVFRSLYREFSDYGSSPIRTRASVFDGASLEEKEISINDYSDQEATKIAAFLESVWDSYGSFTAAQLSDITHRNGTPWRQMFERMGDGIRPFTVIPNDMIKEHYRKLAADSKASDERYATS